MKPAPERSGGAATLSRALVPILGLAAALRLALASRDLTTLDRLFVPDDTYYTLSITRNLAAGLGPTADGVHLTNGFQPLLAFLLVPLAKLLPGPDGLLRATIVLGAVADTVVVGLIARLLLRGRGGRTAALVGAFAWAISPVAIGNALGGLETSLALACTLAFVDLWCRAQRLGTNRAFAFAGALAGVSLLARVDTAFVVGLIGGVELLRGNRRGVMVASVVALVVVAPWWGFELSRLHTLIPESGAAVREQAAVHQAGYLTFGRQLAGAFGNVVGPPFVDLPLLRDVTSSVPALGVVGFVLVEVGLVYGALRAFAGRETSAVRLFVLATVALVAFYAVHVPALWFFRRYLSPAHLAITLVLATGFGVLSKHSARPRLLVAVKVGLGLACAVAVLVTGSKLFVTPRSTLDGGYDGAKGYRAPAKQILAAAPPGAVLGALQSGALGYFASFESRGVRVVNLDGVVDRDAARAFREHTLDQFARDRGITHVADWPFNLTVFRKRCAIAPVLRPVAEAESQDPSGAPTGDRMILNELEWP